MATFLFFDDFYLNRWENIGRHMGQPTLVPEATFRDPDMWLASAYPCVYRTESGGWRCLYQGTETFETYRQKYPLVADSKDGISWELPDLSDRIDLIDRKFPNQTLPMDNFGEWDCYFDERCENPAERVKGLVTGKKGVSYLWTSPNGIVWKKVDGVEWRPGSPDPPSTVFWNEVRQSYVISARPVPPHPRRTAFSETRNWRTFSDPELAIMTDAQDGPLAELYGTVIFPYEGKFVGFMWIYHTDPETMNKYWQGKTDCQFTYSYNGWHFQRALRDPLIPNAEMGQLGAGTMRPTSMLVDDSKNIRIYSSASMYEHGYHLTGEDKGAVILFRLRLDGFVYLQSNAGPGLLGTRPFVHRGGELELNVQSFNEIRVQVTGVDGVPLDGFRFEDGESFVGDQLNWIPRWKNGRSMSALSGRCVRLDIRLNHARIYAIRGDSTFISGRQIARFQETGEVQEPKPGF